MTIDSSLPHSGQQAVEASAESAREAREQSAQAIRTILNSLDALVYVADMETYELLFINDYGKAIWGSNITGKTCWQVLQGSSGPCDFCTNSRLVNDSGELGKVYVWEFRNQVDGRWYQCRDQAIRWVDGRLVRMEIATDISDRKALEVELANARQQAEALSRTDELTGLYNRRAFFELGNRHFSAARRAGTSLAAVMLDADHFKQINDRYGHFAGDQVLRRLAQVVAQQVRAEDVLGRFGGEEFVLVLPGTSSEQAQAFAERLRACIADTGIAVGDETLRCTASLGIAMVTEDCQSLQQLLQCADEALFKAKAQGRNRVAVYVPKRL